MAIPSIGDVRSGGGLKPKGFAKWTTTGAAFQLGGAPDVGDSLPAGCSTALIQAEAQGIRIRPDAAPLAATGFLLPAGEAMILHGELKRWQFIAAAGGAILTVIFLG